jgi:hypothetical protein
MQSAPFHPRGTLLSDSVTFTDRDGEGWLVYLAGLPLSPSRGLWHRTRLPGRMLRFDSAAESRGTRTRPAGAPYLQDERLQELLDLAQPMTG